MRERRRTSTSTSNFGVGARENHDATAFYDRFRAPELSDADDVLPPTSVPEPFVCGDARQMDAVADGSVALVVTSPPYFAGKQYEEELEREGVPVFVPGVPRAADRRVRRVRAHARAGRAHRGERREPRPQAVPQPLGRRDPDPRARSRSAAARRARLAEGRGGERVVRVGLVPQRGEPGAARHHRASASSRARDASTGARSVKQRAAQGLPHESTDRDRGLHGPHPRRLVDPIGERASCRPSGAVPGRAARAADPVVHLRERPRPRPLHGQRVGADRRRPHRTSLRRVRPRSRRTSSSRGGESPR